MAANDASISPLTTGVFTRIAAKLRENYEKYPEDKDFLKFLHDFMIIKKYNQVIINPDFREKVCKPRPVDMDAINAENTIYYIEIDKASKELELKKPGHLEAQQLLTSLETQLKDFENFWKEQPYQLASAQYEIIICEIKRKIKSQKAKSRRLEVAIGKIEAKIKANEISIKANTLRDCENCSDCLYQDDMISTNCLHFYCMKCIDIGIAAQRTNCSFCGEPITAYYNSKIDVADGNKITKKISILRD